MDSDKTMDFLLLITVASNHLIGGMPTTHEDAIRVLDLCKSVLVLYDMIGVYPAEKIGSQTRAKQVLCDYLRQKFERKNGS